MKNIDELKESLLAAGLEDKEIDWGRALIAVLTSDFQDKLATHLPKLVKVAKGQVNTVRDTPPRFRCSYGMMVIVEDTEVVKAEGELKFSEATKSKTNIVFDTRQLVLNFEDGNVVDFSAPSADTGEDDEPPALDTDKPVVAKRPRKQSVG